MTVDNPVQYEVELVERLWSQGWAAMRAGSQPPSVVGDSDVMAMKDGEAIFLNVVVLESGTSSRKVMDEDKELKAVVRRARADGYGQSDNALAIHAIKLDYSDEWKFAYIGEGKISASKDYPDLNEVTLQ